MKKKLIVALILLFFSGVTQAGWNFGGRFGGTASTFSTSGTSFAIGYYAGGLVSYEFNSRFSVGSEVDLTMQGIKFDGTSKYQQQFTQDMYYLHVPVMLGMALRAGFSLGIGPQFGFLLSEVSTIHSAVTEAIEYNIFDFGLAVGIGFEIPNTPIAL